MHILLLIVYGALAGYGIWKMPFLRKSGIRFGWLLTLFILHVVTGWVHNWIAYRYFPDHGDIWNYFSLSFLYRHRLVSEFHLFVSDNSTWTYITHNGIVYVQMLLDLFSGDDMTVNTLLFAFPVFLGNVALFRVFRRRFGDGLAAGSVFWLPSVLFWTACIYREGMLFILLGFLLFHLDRFPDRRSIYYSIVLFLLIAYFRLAVAVVLVPALFTWWVTCSRYSRRNRLWIGLAVVVLLVVGVSLGFLRDRVLQAVTTEQASFQVLDGHSRLPLPVLDGTLGSFWRTLPVAAFNGLFEPLPGSGGRSAYIAFSIELVFVWAVVLLAVGRLAAGRLAVERLAVERQAVERQAVERREVERREVGRREVGRPGRFARGAGEVGMPVKSNYGEFDTIKPESAGSVLPASPTRHTYSAFSVMCLLFAIFGMLLIGFVVPFAGTIVRYRSIYLPFLLAPALHSLRGQPAVECLNRWLNNKLRFLI